MAELKYYPVIGLEDFPTGERLFVEVDGNAIVIFNIGGHFFAIADVCTHDNGELGDGELEGYEVICPRHGARFDVRNGKALCAPAFTDTRSYPVRVSEGKLEIGL